MYRGGLYFDSVEKLKLTKSPFLKHIERGTKSKPY